MFCALEWGQILSHPPLVGNWCKTFAKNSGWGHFAKVLTETNKEHKKVLWRMKTERTLDFTGGTIKDCLSIQLRVTSTFNPAITKWVATTSYQLSSLLPLLPSFCTRNWQTNFRPYKCRLPAISVYFQSWRASESVFGIIGHIQSYYRCFAIWDSRIDIVLRIL